MDEPALNGDPQPGLRGENSARLAAGKFILQVGLPEGALVQLAGPDDLVEPSLRSVPLSELPPGIDDWLDREREIGLIASAMQASGSSRIELYGPPGVGKTALLRYLATHPLSSAFPDGAIYLSTCHQLLPDLLQSIFEIFCQSPFVYRPDDPQLRRSLAGLQAIIFLDDVSLTEQEFFELTGAAPGCTFILASTERRLWHGEESLELAGLPMEAALALFENGLGRPLKEEERVQTYSLAAGLGGRPLHILQAAALARETGRSVLDISSLHSQISLTESIQIQLLEGLTQAERTVIFCLASLQGAAITPDHLAALTGQPDILPVLDRLAALSLAEFSTGRCSLAGGVDELVLNTWDLTEWKFHALVYYTRWSETQPLGSDELRRETNVLLGLLRWAAGTQHWREALRLVRSLEGTLCLSGRWEAWRQALQIGLDAARALSIPAAEAWALHQLGTRLLCSGQAGQARAALIQALRLRQSLRDRLGELATQGNLAMLLQQKSKPQAGLAVLSLSESASSIEETRPVTIPPSSPGRSILPVAVGNLLTPAKTPSRRSVVLVARILLLALILLVPAAFLGWRNLRPEAKAGPAAATAYVLVVQTQVPVVETPGAILYLPILPNQYTVPEGTGAILPETGSSPEPTLASLFPPYTIVPPTPSPGGTATSPGAAASAELGPPSGCPLPPGWLSYTVQPGDSLPLLAAELGISQEDLTRANCLDGVGWLTIGAVIYVPSLPPSTDGPQPTTAPDGTQAAAGGSLSAVPSTPTATSASPADEPPYLVISPVPVAHPSDCLEFEDIDLFAVFRPGDTFTASGINLSMNGFVQDGGSVTQSGVIEVGEGQDAGGSGRELLLYNASVSGSFTSRASGMAMLFNDYSGSLNMAINGDFRGFANFADLQQQVVGGVSVAVSGGQGDGQGSLTLSGPLQSFTIGGEELWIDQICFK